MPTCMNMGTKTGAKKAYLADMEPMKRLATSPRSTKPTISRGRAGRRGPAGLPPADGQHLAEARVSEVGDELGREEGQHDVGAHARHGLAEQPRRVPVAAQRPGWRGRRPGPGSGSPGRAGDDGRHPARKAPVHSVQRRARDPAWRRRSTSSVSSHRRRRRRAGRALLVVVRRLRRCSSGSRPDRSTGPPSSGGLGGEAGLDPPGRHRPAHADEQQPSKPA